MGGGSSNSKLWSLFVNAELVDGSKYLAGDPQFRSVFIEYVRSGQWKDRLSGFSLQDEHHTSRSHIKEVDNVWMKYNCPPGVVVDMSQAAPETCESIQSPRIARKSFVLDAERTICTGFTTSQLTSVMFSILYPLFASSPDDRDCTPQSACRDVRSSQSKVKLQRTQDILVACAEELSEADMDEFLEYPKWVFETSDTFQDFPFSITICDTARVGCPVVYANKAFQALSGYALVDLIGSSLDILNGPATQEVQVNLLKEAVAAGQPMKIGVTHYNKKQKPFINLIASRTCANYAVMVHFPATASGHPEDLKAVDDLLLLVCCVLQAPLLKPESEATNSSSLFRRSLALMKRSFDGAPQYSSKHVRSSVSTKSTTRSSTSSNFSSFNSAAAGSDKSAVNLARLMVVRMGMNECVSEDGVESGTERADEIESGRVVLYSNGNNKQHQ